MNRRRWGAPDSADGVCLRCGLCLTIVAFEPILDNDLHVAAVACSPALHQWRSGRQTHLVHMSSRVKVIECTEDDVERSEPAHVIFRLFDVVLVGGYADLWVELARCLLGHNRLRALNVPRLEQELAVEVREVDGVEVDNFHVLESRQDDVLDCVV